MTVKEVYERTKSDYEDAIERLGSEKLISKYLLKFVDLTDFNDMINSIQIKDWEGGFKASHNLKGIALNMSFTSLAKSGSELCESMRHGEPEEDISALVEKVTKDYENLMTVLKEYQRENNA